MRLGQQMKLAPRMIQSMEILQMPMAELEERIEQELESNPTLEVAEIEAPPEGESPDAPPALADVSIDVLRDQSTRRKRAEERDGKTDAFAAAAARSLSLAEQLREQWGLVDVEEALRPLGELIISFLEEDGYLRTPLETIAERAPIGTPLEGSGLVLETPPDMVQLGRALSAVQLFLEPAGVAARDARECLLLQLDALEDEGADDRPAQVFANARRIVADHLEDVKQNRRPRIAEKTGLTLEEITEALTLLRRLSLAPARRLVEEENRPIMPDVIVEYDEAQDRYLVFLNDARVPNLRVNREYELLSRGKQMDARGKEFLRTNLGNAHFLIEALEQRKRTLLRVAKSVVDKQRDYFDYGPQALRPLKMEEVAEELGIHVATVSRAVSEKHMLTPRGVVALRKFFSGGVSVGKAGDPESEPDMAWEAIKQALKDVVEAEDKKRPLSDDALADALKSKGIEIARRTVAKYRDQLNIPAARLRRVF